MGDTVGSSSWVAPNLFSVVIWECVGIRVSFFSSCEDFLFPSVLGVGPRLRLERGAGAPCGARPCVSCVMLSEALHLPLPPFPICLGMQQRFCEGKFVAVQSPVDRNGKEAQAV